MIFKAFLFKLPLAFVNDSTGAEKLNQIKTWWNHLRFRRPIYGQYPNPSRSYTIVKYQYEQNVRKIFLTTNINITVSRAKHLVAVMEEHCSMAITSDQNINPGTNNQKFFHKFLNCYLKQHIHRTSVDSKTDLQTFTNNIRY